MQQDNYVTIVKNSLNSINYKNDVNYKDVVLAFKKTIDENKDLILTTNNIDITNETGKKIDFWRDLKLVNQKLKELENE